jgi:hypothetical protein
VSYHEIGEEEGARPGTRVDDVTDDRQKVRWYFTEAAGIVLRPDYRVNMSSTFLLQVRLKSRAQCGIPALPW